VLQIAGGILIAFLVIITFPIWGTMLLALLGFLVMNWEIILGGVVLAVLVGVGQAVLPSKIRLSGHRASVSNRDTIDPIRAQQPNKPLQAAKTAMGVRKCSNPNCVRLLPRGVHQCPHCGSETI
jgi:hypothetical protein